MRSWPFWIVVIAVASGPWFGVVREAQWDRVTWVPFRGFEDKPKDVLVNFLLFVPFGWSFVKTRQGAAGVAAAAAAGVAVSIAAELPQLFYRLRDPSATDVFVAMCGSAAGSLASQALYGRDAGGAARGSQTGDARSQDQ